MVAAAFPRPDYEDPDSIYEALRSQKGTRLNISGGKINAVFTDGTPGLDRSRVLRWIETSATALATYFGRYPTRQLGLLIVADDGDRIGHGTTYGYRGPAIRIHVGVGAGEKAFTDDWVLVHEMMHTALPDLPRRALWLQEGNATWVEPVARAQAGQLPPTEVWRQAIRGMPNGMRDSDAGSMDGARDWGRLYWGGAIFWLEAEIAIYEQSNGRFLLRDALRAINRASGGNGADWSPEEMMAVGDRATATAALQDLYARFSSTGIQGDLRSLFDRLGVAADPQSGVRFDPHAELSDLTRRITQR